MQTCTSTVACASGLFSFVIRLKYEGIVTFLLTSDGYRVGLVCCVLVLMGFLYRRSLKSDFWSGRMILLLSKVGKSFNVLFAYR